jgi:ribosomal protein L11 methyltransferase
MNTIELHCIIHASKQEKRNIADILIAQLATLGFYGFIDTDDGLKAYIHEDEYDFTKVRDLSVNHIYGNQIDLKHTKIKEQNWNETWEKSFDPVVVDDTCIVRAPFHHQEHTCKYEIIIEPKMSFGTGHHATTELMIQAVLHTEVNQKRVLDMGCGTGILAILAYKKNAKEVWAVDNDDWAYNNALENIKINKADAVKVFHGDSSVIKNKTFDIIFANINKNILLADMALYVKSLENTGYLWVSGIYRSDLKAIEEKANQNNLVLNQVLEKNEWVAARFTKNV